MRSLGLGEILIILLVIVVLFGAKRIPEFVRGLSQAAKEFRKGMASEPEKDEKKSE